MCWAGGGLTNAAIGIRFILIKKCAIAERNKPSIEHKRNTFLCFNVRVLIASFCENSIALLIKNGVPV